MSLDVVYIYTYVYITYTFKQSTEAKSVNIFLTAFSLSLSIYNYAFAFSVLLSSFSLSYCKSYVVFLNCKSLWIKAPQMNKCKIHILIREQITFSTHDYKVKQKSEREFNLYESCIDGHYESIY